MNNSNRRTFIRTAGVGAAAAGVAAMIPVATSAVASAASAPVAAVKLPAAAKGSMVAYIQDVSTGEVSVMVEGREVTVVDHQLVAKLAHALHSNTKI